MLAPGAAQFRAGAPQIVRLNAELKAGGHIWRQPQTPPAAKASFPCPRGWDRASAERGCFEHLLPIHLGSFRINADVDGSAHRVISEAKQRI